MKTFRITFNAKKLGSIGIPVGYIENVKALDKRQARRVLYHKYEHVHVISVEEIEDE